MKHEKQRKKLAKSSKRRDTQEPQAEPRPIHVERYWSKTLGRWVTIPTNDERN